MKVNNLSKEKNTVTLELEEEYSELEKFIDSTYKKEVKKVRIPGFRVGKAPKNIFINYYGKKRIEFDALLDMLNAKYPFIVQEEKIEAIDQPKDFDIIELIENKPIKVKLSVDVKPEVKISKYKGLKLEKEILKVTKEDIEKELVNLQEKFVTYNDEENSKIQDGDSVEISIKATKDSEEYALWTKSNYSFKVGRSMVGKNFDDQLIGLNLNQEKEFKLSFDEAELKKELIGKDVEFKVTILSIKKKTLPKLTDEFISEKTDAMTLEDYKKKIEDKLRANIELTSENKIKEDVSTWIIENVEVEVPEIMIEKETNNILRKLESNITSHGISVENYLKILQKTPEDLRTQYKDDAEKNVKLILGLNEIAKIEKIEATDSDIEEEISDSVRFEKDEKIKEDYKQKLREMKGQIAETVLNKKVMDFVIDNAKIKKINK
jgi:trigger factor